VAFLAGQRSIIEAYDLKILEDNVISNARQLYTIGCVEGVKLYTGTPGSMISCLDISFKAVQDQEDIIRNKIWKF